MSKSIFVADTPSKCGGCQFVYYRKVKDKVVEYRCILDLHEVKELDKKEHCPLKPIPRRITSSLIVDGKVIEDGYQCGWNDCIDSLEEE